MEAQVARKCRPYMPDSARAAMPNSPLQPLPPYLREDFQQCLDKERPHEYLDTVVHGKVIPPNKCSNLRYRYLDTRETVLVPNIWYNQTQAMRVAHWQWQVKVHEESLAAAKRHFAWVKESSDKPTFLGTPIAIALRRAEGDVEMRTRMLGEVQTVLADVQAGRRLI